MLHWPFTSSCWGNRTFVQCVCMAVCVFVCTSNPFFSIFLHYQHSESTGPIIPDNFNWTTHSEYKPAFCSSFTYSLHVLSPNRPAEDHQLESELHQASHTRRQLAGPQSWNQRKVLLCHIWACRTWKLLLLWPRFGVRPYRWHQGWYRRNGEWWGFSYRTESFLSSSFFPSCNLLSSFQSSWFSTLYRLP